MTQQNTIHTEQQARYATTDELLAQYARQTAEENKAYQKRHDAFKALHNASMTRQDNPTDANIKAEEQARQKWEKAKEEVKATRDSHEHRIIRDELRRREQNKRKSILAGK